MEIAQYVKEIKTCPDNELTSRLGIYDNFPILLRATAKTIAGDLWAREYILDRTSDDVQAKMKYFMRDPLAVVLLQIMPGGGDLTYKTIPGVLNRPVELEHIRRQRDTYMTSIDLHATREGPYPLRDYARVALDIAAYAVEKKIAFCFPDSPGDSKDPDRIVYCEP